MLGFIALGSFFFRVVEDAFEMRALAMAFEEFEILTDEAM